MGHLILLTLIYNFTFYGNHPMRVFVLGGSCIGIIALGESLSHIGTLLFEPVDICPRCSCSSSKLSYRGSCLRGILTVVDLGVVVLTQYSHSSITRGGSRGGGVGCPGGQDLPLLGDPQTS